MMFRNTCVTLCALGCLPLAMAQEKPKQQLTARELFYAAVQAPAATPAHPSAKARSRTAKKTEGAEVAVAPRKSAPSPGPAPSHGVSLPGGASLIPASAGPPLGLRYTIVKVGDGGRTEVSPDTPFHAGDQIQINVQPNLPGYLYIVSRGSSGTWKPVFPSPEVDEGNNHVDGLVTYALPSKTNVLTFDEQPGIEKLFIVLSREPEPDLEKMIYSLQS
ncbi:MAG TPA: DUF4384 domain-containing protein, partial [Bryobacteraceae bacterium]|nr:DUF4384 domain-containing protein [Bryobacteraceae bacterium]